MRHLTEQEARESLELGAEVFNDPSVSDSGWRLWEFGGETYHITEETVTALEADGTIEPWTPRKAVEAGEFATEAEAIAAGGYVNVFIYAKGY